MTIFTLIEYTEGGNKAPCSCCTEWEYGQLQVNNFDHTEYENVASIVARILHEQHMKNYHFETMILLIDGIPVPALDTSDVHTRADNRFYTENEPNGEQAKHEEYAETFMARVAALNANAIAAYVKEQAEIREREERRRKESEERQKRDTEERERKQLEILSKKYGIS